MIKCCSANLVEEVGHRIKHWAENLLVSSPVDSNAIHFDIDRLVICPCIDENGIALRRDSDRRGDGFVCARWPNGQGTRWRRGTHSSESEMEEKGVYEECLEIHPAVWGVV